MARSDSSTGSDETPQVDSEAERRLVLDLTHLDELTPDDEEEISRFRRFAAAGAAPSAAGKRLGRIFGHRQPGEGRVAS